MLECRKLRAKSYEERLEFIRSKWLCFGCLAVGHHSNQCRARMKCGECENRHPTLLHRYREQPLRKTDEHTREESPRIGRQGYSQGTAPTPRTEVAQSHMGAGEGQYTLAVIPVRVKSPGTSTTVDTYAFMDPGSNVSFCSEAFAEQLGVSSKAVNMELGNMGRTQKFSTRRILGLEVSGLGTSATVELPPLYTKAKMPEVMSLRPRQEEIRGFRHLEGIKIPEIGGDVGLLIGNKAPDAYAPEENRTGPPGSPYATRSAIGWMVWGLSRDSDQAQYQANHAEALAIGEAEHLRRLEGMVRSAIDYFPERLVDSRKEASVEDRQFEEITSRSLELVEGHYQCDLPFRDRAVPLEDGKSTAMSRLMSLRKKMRGDASLHQDYTTFMGSLLEKGYAEKVNEDAEEGSATGGRWYMPHHAVYNPNKARKIRVVFDCSAKTRGVSLNDVLLPGPSLINTVVDVLLRFRQHPVGLMGDIEGMFFQVRVSERHRDFLRYLWFPDGDISRPPEVYHLKAHPFGAVSSPACAAAALRRCAADNQHPEIPRGFYVDDYLKAASDVRGAVDARRVVQEVCKKGGFRLHKWISNREEVNKSIPPEDRATSRQLDIERNDQQPCERALGIFWNTVEDTFGFRVKLRNCPATRRGILSTVSSIFDPLVHTSFRRG